jgi:hypothetical protein
MAKPSCKICLGRWGQIVVKFDKPQKNLSEICNTLNHLMVSKNYLNQNSAKILKGKNPTRPILVTFRSYLPENTISAGAIRQDNYVPIYLEIQAVLHQYGVSYITQDNR